jgi:ribosomal protein S27AE
MIARKICPKCGTEFEMLENFEFFDENEESEFIIFRIICPACGYSEERPFLKSLLDRIFFETFLNVVMNFIRAHEVAKVGG